MKVTLTTNEIIHQLYADHNSSWSYYGAIALAKWLEEMEEEAGEEHELDLVALRCDFAEYTSAIDVCVEYGLNANTEQDAIDILREKTIVIKVSDSCNSVIVQNF